MADHSLFKLLEDILPTAQQLGYDAMMIGGLLKIYPRGTKGRAMLGLSGKNGVIIVDTHRTDDLTRRYKGRIVTKKWVIGFLEANRDVATERSTTFFQKQREKTNNYQYDEGVTTGNDWREQE